MPNLTCPTCTEVILPEEVNIAEGAALCRACGTLHRLRDILDGQSSIEPALPPVGCSIVDDVSQTTLRASARSWRAALAALGVAAFWNGGLSIFIAQALAVSYRHLFGYNATWLPLPNWSGYPNGLPPVWFAVFLWLFLLPFIVIGLLMIGWLLTAVGGRVDVRLRGVDGVAWLGCGPFGWRRRFDATQVKSVRLGRPRWSSESNGQESSVIVIEAERVLRIGSTLPLERRRWMAAALRRLLISDHRSHPPISYTIRP